MRNATVVLSALAAILVTGPLAARAPAGAIIELIGEDPSVFPKAPEPAIIFSPEPTPPPENNPTPVPDPESGSGMKTKRLENAVLPNPGDSAVVPTEVTWFYLSGGPVNVEDEPYTLTFTLDPAQSSTGQMTIIRSTGGDYGGTFESFFDVFLIGHFEPVPGGGGTAFDAPTSEHFTMDGTWVGVPLDEANPEEQQFVMTVPGPDSYLTATDVDYGGVLYLEPVPEPATVLLMALGLAALAARRKRLSVP